MRDRNELERTARKLGPMRVQHIDGQTLYASRRHELFASTDGGESFTRAGSLPVGIVHKLATRPSLVARFLRAGFHHLTKNAAGDLIATVRGAIVARRASESDFRITHRVERGMRPLTIAAAPSGNLFFGEYFGNPERGPVHIYGSRDGQDWSVVHTFPAGAVRHVHAIHADPERGGLYVLTGDDGDEAGIFWTGDEFRTLETVARGTQSARAVALLHGPQGPILPTDTPHERNWIQRLDVSSGRLERLAELPGTVFFSTATPKLYVVSTVIEPSPVNRSPHVELFASRDGEAWHSIARFKRDLPLLNDRRGYLQYPTLILPTGTSRLPYLFASGQSIEGLHGQLLRWSEADIVAALDANRESEVQAA